MPKLVLPGQQVSIQVPTGEIDPVWYEKLRALAEAINSITGGGSGATITLTGDVTGSGVGTIPTAAIKLQGHPVSPTAPLANQVLEWVGTAWTPTNLPAAPPFVAPMSTVAGLSPSGPVGALYYVTDGSAGLGWSALVTGGGSARYLVWFNGANWTVVGDGGYAPGVYHPTYHIYGF
jgi:hypothetical protein